MQQKKLSHTSQVSSQSAETTRRPDKMQIVCYFQLILQPSVTQRRCTRKRKVSGEKGTAHKTTTPQILCEKSNDEAQTEQGIRHADQHLHHGFLLSHLGPIHVEKCSTSGQLK